MFLGDTTAPKVSPLLGVRVVTQPTGGGLPAGGTKQVVASIGKGIRMHGGEESTIGSAIETH